MQIADFNRQMAHLLDLVEVLQAEMRDFKAYFTPFLDLYVVFGTASFAATFLLLAKWTCWLELIATLISGTVGMSNMLYSLCAGATYELVSRKIYLMLQPLLANELSLLSPSVVRRIQLICVHLSKLENRAVVVLGNFPLNYGSLTSILGWIVTGNLLIKRFAV